MYVRSGCAVFCLSVQYIQVQKPIAHQSDIASLVFERWEAGREAISKSWFHSLALTGSI
jgi:hypothetical protein